VSAIEQLRLHRRGMIGRLAPIGASAPWRSRRQIRRGLPFWEADGRHLRHHPAVILSSGHHPPRLACSSRLRKYHLKRLIVMSTHRRVVPLPQLA
jgi:hypothetical protein